MRVGEVTPRVGGVNTRVSTPGVGRVTTRVGTPGVNLRPKTTGKCNSREISYGVYCVQYMPSFIMLRESRSNSESDEETLQSSLVCISKVSTLTLRG